MFQRKRPQTEIFSSFGWWDKGCFLLQVTGDRCDYIQSCVERAFGKGALAQQEVLEVGCGGGLICVELGRRQALMVGVDPSQGALATAREHTRKGGLGQNIYYQQGYAEKLPYADGSFSVIICLDVLEHVQNLEAAIREITRVLAPGGIFIFDTINRTWMARVALIWYGEHFASGLTPGLHNYDDFIKPVELRALLTYCGLQVREIKGFMPNGFAHGHMTMGPGWFMGVSYVGYATKAR